VRVAEPVRVREIDDDEGQRPLRIIRRDTGSVVTWRRAQTVLLSAQGMPVAKTAEVIHPRRPGPGRNPQLQRRRLRLPLPQRREFKKIAKSKPTEHGLPFSTWSLAKLANFLVAEGVVDDISHKGLRVLLREEGVSFQRIKTWKTSRDPDYAAKKARVKRLCAVADGEVIPEDSEPEVVICLDEFGPLNLQPHPGRQWVRCSVLSASLRTRGPVRVILSVSTRSVSAASEPVGTHSAATSPSRRAHCGNVLQPGAHLR